jgi:hypothetical protein
MVGLLFNCFSLAKGDQHSDTDGSIGSAQSRKVAGERQKQREAERKEKEKRKAERKKNKEEEEKIRKADDLKAQQAAIFGEGFREFGS